MQVIFNLIFTILLFFQTNTVIASAIKIAAILKLEDAYCDYPKDILSSMKFALKTIPTRHKITLEAISHDGSPESIGKAIKAAKQFGPDIVIAGETSQMAMMIAKEFKNQIFISPTASTNKLKDVHPFPIRMIHPDDQYVKVVEHVLRFRPKASIGILHNISYPNAELIGINVIAYLRSKKLNPVIVTTQAGSEIDSKTLSPFVKAKIDVLVIFSFETDLRKTYSVLNSNKIHPLYVGADGWGRDSSLLKNLLSGEGRKFHGIRTLYWNSTRSDVFFKTTVTALEKATRKKADAFHAIGFDTMKLTIDNLNNIRNIKDFVTSLKPHPFKDYLTTTDLKYSSNLIPLKDFYLYELKNGQIRYKQKIKL